jgi:hypothetical protein
VPEATVADLGPEGRTGPLGGTLSGEIGLGQVPGGLTRALDTPSAATGLWDATPAEQTPSPPADRPAPTIAGYEIEGELGRGAMGVVYLARQVRLNRPCALKVILAGAHADPVAAVRFLGEAEAVARLQHPGIVQIHAIGEADGLPFLELEYVPGGSLDRTLNGTPWPARRAATLVEALTQAVVEAHRLGIVHRDLKPGNIPGDDRAEVPSEGPGEAVQLGRGAGRGSETVSGRPADPGAAAQPHRAFGAVGPPQPGPGRCAGGDRIAGPDSRSRLDHRGGVVPVPGGGAAPSRLRQSRRTSQP